MKLFPCFVVFDGRSLVVGDEGCLVYDIRDAAEAAANGVSTDYSETVVVVELQNLQDLNYYFRD